MSLPEAFRETLDALAGPDLSGPFAVAVSGGGDSVALMALAAEWAAARGRAVRVVTVDHGLRPAAADEAEAVGRQAAALALPHDTLRWQGWDGAGNLQAEARAARYRLLSGWASAQSIGAVLLGHTQDDNVESFVMGLARGAGLDGLSGMRPRFDRDGVAFLRPLLAVPRSVLRAYLTERGLRWIDDPSNEDDRFDRVRIRKALAASGVDQGRIAESVRNLRRSRAGIDEALADWVPRHVREETGGLVIASEPFAALPAEFRRRIVNAALRWVAGTDYPPRAEPVMRLVEGGWNTRGRTLHGCLIRSGKQGLLVSREPGAARAAREVAVGAIWDGRWRVQAPPDADTRGLTLRALGVEGLALCPGWRETGAARPALLASPAIWRGETLVAAPFGGRPEGWRACVVRSFAASFAPH